MPRIRSTGAYIPFYRLKMEDIAKAWGGGRKGEKAVANFDQDSITMAVEAARDCLKGIDRSTVDGVYFVTTTSPYKEKQCASVVATVLDLDRKVITADFNHTMRGATIAIRSAMDAVTAGSARNVLVVASDCRMGAPGSEYERLFGDGAAAVLIGSEGPIAIDGTHTHSDEIIDLWRTNEHPYVRSWEDRFTIEEGLKKNVVEAVKDFTATNNRTIAEYTKVCMNATDARKLKEVNRAIKVAEEQVQMPLYDSVGNTGAAFGLMTMIDALENAKVGDKVLLINYGDGCDVLSVKVEKDIVRDSEARGVKGFLPAKHYLPTYEKYIQLKKLMDVEISKKRPIPVSSASILKRHQQEVLPFKGSKCTCGRTFYPPQRICLYCKAKDQFELITLAENKGTLYTFAKDFLALTIDPPLVVSIVNLDAQCRFYCQMTDRDPDQVEADMRVELTFRKMTDAEGYPNYFWKCVPIR